MSDQLQLPVIKTSLSDHELRLHCLVLATTRVNHTQALELAKQWSDWVINNK